MSSWALYSVDQGLVVFLHSFSDPYIAPSRIITLGPIFDSQMNLFEAIPGIMTMRTEAAVKKVGQVLALSTFSGLV